MERPDEMKIKTLKGTTTVGLRTKDGVVLAADRRASAGFYVAHKNVRKVLYVTDKLAVTTAGSVADIQFLYNVLSNVYRYNSLIGRPTTIKAMSTYVANILSSSKYFPYVVQFLIGGYDDAPKLYNLDYLGDMTEEKFVATGSGSPVAIGLLEDEYSEEMELDQAVDLARRAITSAIKRDSFTGTSVIVAKLYKDGHQEFEFPVKKA
ncbi:proteasome subunit beta [Sulfodiicoccus acidiphilus]|uniref:Proteasome subunit beta n=1 Tax=Sulfodiicoccus acidiphilus TaxID=1670455 RepID=A0A348B316_9CREN|nr:archaeal proteasome endopeptidase complex subunit beta [Sulfodiicoccus acidiphilus]BBD72568.1 proteasome subunit beta [Sulfodiicoccus acidiphilus]GGT93607.1 proteasome subunit beta [Sulfodiicoccus acidiphilus]